MLNKVGGMQTCKWASIQKERKFPKSKDLKATEISFCCPKSRSEVVSQVGRDLKRLKREDRYVGVLPDSHPLS